MRFFDLSQPLFDNCPHCPVHPPVRIQRVADHPNDGWRMETISMASHTGTHLDAPLHKLASGASIDAIALERFCGTPRCAELEHLSESHPISAEDLASCLGGLEPDRIVLLVTGWGLKRSHSDSWIHRSPRLAPSGARWLVEHQVRGVGIDHFSIGGTSEPDNAATHEILLGSGIWVVEELCFRDGWRIAASTPGCLFQALPLLAPGFSGTPCRAVFQF